MFWFNLLNVKHHVIASKTDLFPGRSLIVRKLKMIQCEAIVRGYITGSAWTEYKTHGTVHGIKLRPGLLNCQKLDTPLFTPSTKVDLGDHGNL